MRYTVREKLFSLLLIALICVSLYPVSARAESELTESYEAGESVADVPVSDAFVPDVSVVAEPASEDDLSEGPITEEPLLLDEAAISGIEDVASEQVPTPAALPEELLSEDAVPVSDPQVDSGDTAPVTAPEELEELFSEVPPEPLSLVVDVDTGNALLDEYAERELNSLLPRRRGPLRAAKNVGAGLSGPAAVLYAEHKSLISQIAAGQRESAVISLPLETLFEGKLTWTADELGIDAIVEDGVIKSKDVYNALYGMLDTRSVLTALLYDCPYEMYWYDKTAGISYGFDSRLSTSGGRTAVDISGSFFINYSVAAEYAGSADYTVNTALGQQVQSAVSNAQSIVSAAASYGLVDKLNYYRQQICNLVSYNDTAAAGGTAYGNPWQLIWVFDDDSSTNVVCEGYAKAFQYLCDLSDIGDATCYTVTGNMTAGTGAGRHMWNIVTMPDGKNYLVDITNCDSGSIGYPDRLFLKGYSSCTGYTYYDFSGVTYEYDDTVLTTFSEADLTLSATDYGVQPRIPGDVNDDGQVNDLDLIHLREYLAGAQVDINVENANVTGDDLVNGLDLIRLRKYLAGAAVELQ